MMGRFTENGIPRDLHTLGSLILGATFPRMTNNIRIELIRIARTMLNVARAWRDIDLDPVIDENSIHAFENCFTVFRSTLSNEGLFDRVFSNPQVVEAFEGALRDLAVAFQTRTRFSRSTCLTDEILQLIQN